MTEAQQEAAAPQKEEALAGVFIKDDADTGDTDTPEPEAAEQPEQEAADEDQSDAGDGDEGGEDDDGAEKLFDGKQQEVFERAIARNTYRYKTQIEAEQRRAQELEQRLQALEQGGSNPQAATDPQTGAPVVMDIKELNPFDADYEAKLVQRDEQIQRYARWEAEQEMRQQQTQAEHQKHIEALNKRTQSYLERGKDLGLTAEDIQKAGEFINQAGGIAVELIDDILDDEAGPAIPHYLYRNPEELQKVQQMGVAKAARYIEREIRPKAVRNAKRKAAPPPPVSTETGTGAREDEMPAGAQFL
jgi:hypothetical protein